LIPNVVTTQQAARHLDAALVKRLEEKRFGETKKKTTRGPKVPAGQSYSSRDDEMEDEVEEGLLDDPDEVEETEEEEENEEVEKPEELPDIEPSVTGSYVVAVYEEQWFLAQVSADQNNVKKGYCRLEYMAIRGINVFSSPEKPDIHMTCEEDILMRSVSPELVNNRGFLLLSLKDHKKVKSLMVVVLISSNLFIFIFKKISSLKNFQANLKIGRILRPL